MSIPRSSEASKILIFDTTMRDGELAPGISFDLAQKIEIAELLAAMKVDIVEVGYPGVNKKDFAEIVEISSRFEDAIVCGLTNSKAKEIEILGNALKNACRSRINIFTNVNLA